jgi:hypothetical protein
VADLLAQQLRELRTDWVRRGYTWSSETGQLAWEMGLGQMTAAAARNADVVCNFLHAIDDENPPEQSSLDLASLELVDSLAHASSIAIGANHLPAVYELLQSVAEVTRLLAAVVVAESRRGSVELEQPRGERLEQEIRLHWDDDRKPRGLRAIIDAVNDTRDLALLRAALLQELEGLRTQLTEFAGGTAHIVERDAAGIWSLALADYDKSVRDGNALDAASELARALAGTQQRTAANLESYVYAQGDTILRPNEDWHRQLYGPAAEVVVNASSEDFQDATAALAVLATVPPHEWQTCYPLWSALDWVATLIWGAAKLAECQVTLAAPQE